MTLFGDDSDCELELLPSNNFAQAFGEHELKTAPLVTRDAADFCRKFVQKGFLGSVFSVHSDDIPSNTEDPRLYMNLDAPSSGLVCGVQGSGKSHSVSCIMESSLIVDRRIGTLPAPLATVVFHFDEENGGRPCEAAFLSELKSGDRGVKEVVVLVSPSNLKTRKAVYKGLKYVDVQALRIAEKDINASRMLSMMGADNLETMPLYLHTALSILREMGSDDFTYAGFRKRLSDSEFNQSQIAMLQLRLDLLDSFLQGKGGDVSSFFKPGRLVIIDLSDPFVDGITASMLFDICLGLFVEWKSSAGKLIVLDEAHKYLTNADANRFTKSICSIIRQQRHLSARVVVSTQEPTVVPASVLDLLSWVVCHRFSSPSWVKHLMHHLCVEEEEIKENASSASKAFDWGQRVMTLRTGEALVYSPASLFLSNDRKLGTLGTGYAIVKMRARLTRDGGESLLATAPAAEEARPVASESGMLTPESSSSPRNVAPAPKIEPDYVLDIRSMMHRSSASKDASQGNKTGSGNTANHTSLLSTSTTPLANLARPPNPPAVASIINAIPVATTPIIITGASKLPTTTADNNLKVATPNQTSLTTYKVLIDIMVKLAEDDLIKVDISDLAQAVRKHNKDLYVGKFKRWLEDAEAAGIISLTTKKSRCWASLTNAVYSPSAILAVSNQHIPLSTIPIIGGTSTNSTLLPSSRPNITAEPPLPSAFASNTSPVSVPSNTTKSSSVSVSKASPDPLQSKSSNIYINSTHPSRNVYGPMLDIIHKFENIRAQRGIPIPAIERDPAIPAALSACGFSTFSSFLTQAEKDGVAICYKSQALKNCTCLELTSLFTSLPIQSSTRIPLLPLQPAATPPSFKPAAQKVIPTQYETLITIAKRLASDGQWVRQCNLGVEIAKCDAGCYQRTGLKRLKDYILAAQKQGLVEARGTSGFEELRLRV